MRTKHEALKKEDLIAIQSQYKSLVILKRKFDTFKPAISSLYLFHEYINQTELTNDSDTETERKPIIVDIHSFEGILNKVIDLINILFIQKEEHLMYMHLNQKEKKKEYTEKAKLILHKIALYAQSAINKYNNIYYLKKINNNHLIENDQDQENINKPKLNKGCIYIEIMPLIIADYLEKNRNIEIIDLDKDKSASLIYKLNKQTQRETNRYLDQSQNKILQLTHSIKSFIEILPLISPIRKELRSGKSILPHTQSLFTTQTYKVKDKPLSNYQSLSNGKEMPLQSCSHSLYVNNTKVLYNELKEASLIEIYKFYMNQNNPGRIIRFGLNKPEDSGLDLSKFSKFISDFNISISKETIGELFRKNTMLSKNKYLSLLEFNTVLDKIAILMNNEMITLLRKRIKKITQYSLSMKENQFTVKSNFQSHDNFNSHRIAKQEALEMFSNRKNKSKEDIIKLQSEVALLNKLTINEMQKRFYLFIGIDESYSYRSKLQGYTGNSTKPFGYSTGVYQSSQTCGNIPYLRDMSDKDLNKLTIKKKKIILNKEKEKYYKMLASKDMNKNIMNTKRIKTAVTTRNGVNTNSISRNQDKSKTEKLIDYKSINNPMKNDIKTLKLKDSTINRNENNKDLFTNNNTVIDNHIKNKDDNAHNTLLKIYNILSNDETTKEIQERQSIEVINTKPIVKNNQKDNKNIKLLFTPDNKLISLPKLKKK